MPHKRETHMVCNLHFPTGTTYFRIWNRRAFQERNPYQFPGRMKNSPYHCPGRGANKQGVPHPTHSAIIREATRSAIGRYETHTVSHMWTFNITSWIWDKWIWAMFELLPTWPDKIFAWPEIIIYDQKWLPSG